MKKVRASKRIKASSKGPKAVSAKRAVASQKQKRSVSKRSRQKRESLAMVKGKAVLGRGLSALVSAAPIKISLGRDFNDGSALEASGGTAMAAQSFTQGIENLPLESSASSPVPTSKHRFVAIELVEANRFQPRQTFNETELNELAASIKNHGVLQPPLVRPHSDKPGSYELIAGERRLRAAKRAGLTQIPVIVEEFSDKESLEIALIENVQRSDLNPVEEAEAYVRLGNEFNLTQDEIAERVGKERATVSNIMRLLKLPGEVLELVRERKLTLGHAKAILTVKEPAAQQSLARKVVEEALSVRALEAIVSRVVVIEPAKAGGHIPERKVLDAALNPFPDALERIRNKLGTKVLIRHHPTGRGKIEVEYFSEEELDRIIEAICL
jgi:ParB family chromosome partitioning protein